MAWYKKLCLKKSNLIRGVISTFFLEANFFFHATGLLKKFEKAHFICSNFTLFIVPFLSFFSLFSFFLFFLFFFLPGGDAPQPPQMTPLILILKGINHKIRIFKIIIMLPRNSKLWIIYIFEQSTSDISVYSRLHIMQIRSKKVVPCPYEASLVTKLNDLLGGRRLFLALTNKGISILYMQVFV